MNMSAKHATQIVMLLVIALAICVIYNYPIYLGILASILLTLSYLFYLNFSLDGITQDIYRGITRVTKVIAILTSVGVMIALWMKVGVLSYLLHISLPALTAINTLFGAFAISWVLSMLLGTAIGTIGSIAPLLLAVSVSIGIPSPLMVGAIVSGAYFGDRTSPLSSSANLIASSCQVTTTTHFLSMLKTSYIPVLVSGAIYYIIGLKFQVTDYAAANIAATQEILKNYWALSPWLLLPIAVLLLSILVIRRGILVAVIFSIGTTLVLGLINAIPIQELLQVSLVGFYHTSVEVATLFEGSGVVSMMRVFAVIVSAATLNAIYERYQVLSPLFQLIDPHILNEKRLQLTSGLVSLIIMIITCNQSLPAIITGRHYASYYDAMSVPRQKLGRAISDFSIILVALIPWNINALLVLAVTGVPAVAYVPYAVLPPLILVYSTLYILLSPTSKNRKPV